VSVDNFIPTLWNDAVFQGYDKRFVFGNLANREYEGMISGYGDSVRVNEIGDMSASAYTGTVTYATPDDAQKVLQIDKQYYVANTLDDVDDAQTKPKLMTEIGRKMGVAIGDEIDQSIAALYSSAGVTSGTTSVPISITSANIVEYISLMSQAFAENNVGTASRVAVVHPWFTHKLRLAGVDTKTDNTELFDSGIIARALGWTFYESNNCSLSGTTWYANYFFVQGETLALAEQLMETEAVRHEASFGDGLRQLAVWGVKAMAPESLGILYATAGSET